MGRANRVSISEDSATDFLLFLRTVYRSRGVVPLGMGQGWGATCAADDKEEPAAPLKAVLLAIELAASSQRSADEGLVSWFADKHSIAREEIGPEIYVAKSSTKRAAEKWTANSLQAELSPKQFKDMELELTPNEYSVDHI